MPDNDILEIDAGNTDFKWRVLSGGKILANGRAGQVDVNRAIPSIFNGEYSIGSVRVVSVAGRSFDSAMNSALQSCSQVSVQYAQVERQKAGVLCGYEDLSQLGVDRWMAVIAAASAFQTPVMVVDMGSALTIDFVNEKREHCGGYILPGWGLMQKSLVEGTAITASRIPGVYAAESIAPGLNTVDAIGMGRLRAMTATIDAAYSDFNRQLGVDVSLVCTGGDAPDIVPHLGSEATYVADLVLDGLAIALD